MTQTSVESRFLLIPTLLTEDTNLTHSDMILYGQIMCLSNKYGYCWASDEYLAKIQGCSVRELQNRLKNLVDLGYVRRESEKHGINWKRKLYALVDINSKNVYETNKCAPRNEQVCASKRTGVRTNNKSINNIREQQKRASARVENDFDSHTDSDSSHDSPPSSDTASSQEQPSPPLPAAPPSPTIADSKKELDTIPGLTDDQKMTVCRMNSYESVSQAVNLYHATEQDPSSPFNWLMQCCKQKWWQSADPEKLKAYERFNSFVKAIKALYAKNGFNGTVESSKRQVRIRTPLNDYMTLSLRHFSTDKEAVWTLKAFKSKLRASNVSWKYKILAVMLSEDQTVKFEVDR